MILTRYILKEHLGPFIFALLLITFVFLLNIVFRDLSRIISRGIDVPTVFEFLGLNLSWIIALAVPMAVLVATLMTFGRLSADNEVTAIKASGVSFYQLLLPILAASLLLTVGLIVYNNTVLPHFNHRARLLMEDILRKRPTLKLEPNLVFTDIPNLNLLAKAIVEQGDSSRLENIIIDDHSDNETRKTIFAEWGILKFDKVSDRLFLNLYQGEIHEIDAQDFTKYRKLRFERYRINVEIPGMSLKRSESEYRGDREKSVKMMQQDIDQYRESIAKRQESIHNITQRQMREISYSNWLTQASDSASTIQPVERQQLALTTSQKQAVRRKLEGMKSQIEMEQRMIRSYSRSIDSLLVEIHKKYSIPVACLIFVLIGAPLGILTRKGNLGVAGGISLFFFLLYWVFLIGGEELADRQLISPIWAMWAPNVLVGMVGLYLVLFTVREYRPRPWRHLKLRSFRKGRTYEQA